MGRGEAGGGGRLPGGRRDTNEQTLGWDKRANPGMGQTSKPWDAANEQTLGCGKRANPGMQQTSQPWDAANEQTLGCGKRANPGMRQTSKPWDAASERTLKTPAWAPVVRPALLLPFLLGLPLPGAHAPARALARLRAVGAAIAGRAGARACSWRVCVCVCVLGKENSLRSPSLSPPLLPTPLFPSFLLLCPPFPPILSSHCPLSPVSWSQTPTPLQLLGHSLSPLGGGLLGSGFCTSQRKLVDQEPMV